ncbi:class I SAM-dependent methyltransferase [Patescibacteria group bacterium]|nr:class I SAM-dependent methyltransferase [Patescibacteria group bacterium]MBU0777377.1 class I SAM-dependent methyltransferase [Patescibacteria group bacterium]MBU0845645.1 class I SAM-dependent methyltransferase [Patescibacteria group bacterium]MBU0923074.1 class I SAM-dependent methyltransferase [Patescibacteria group bacterium]MBU1066513.1 class I SAM-dependent methyltransferase [Patescibacteria group bacterium]
MKVKQPWWGVFLDRFVKNYSREEVAVELGLSGQACLDVACGDGELINRFLHKKYKKLIGVDLAPGLIKKAKKKANDNTEYIISDIDTFVQKAILKKQKFDTVYMLAILEHISWPLELLTKLSKIVGKGGRVVVEVPNVAWLPHRINLMLGNFPETAPTHGVIPGVCDEHIRFFALHSLDLVFSRAGFKRERIDCAGRLRLLKHLWVPLFSPDLFAVYYKG